MGWSNADATQFDVAFAYVGPKLWNVLPSYMRAIRELEEFKRKLTGFIYNYNLQNHWEKDKRSPIHVGA